MIRSSGLSDCRCALTLEQGSLTSSKWLSRRGVRIEGRDYPRDANKGRVCVFSASNVIERAKALHDDDLGARAKDTMKQGIALTVGSVGGLMEREDGFRMGRGVLTVVLSLVY